MLAIVIPYYKHIFFEETLKSLSAQTDKRFNVYIGDDASPESPDLLLEKYKKYIDFKYYRFNNNVGGDSLSKHWERCINLTNQEDWIMILGDDDMLGKEVVSEWYKKFNLFENKSNVIRFSTIVINDEFKLLSDPFFHPEWESVTDFFFRKINGKTRSSMSEYVFSRKSFLKYKFQDYPLAWHTDDAAWFDFSDLRSVFSINDAFVYVRASDFSISGNQNNLKAKSKATFKFYNYLLTVKAGLFSEEQKDQLLLRIMNSYLNDKKKLTYFFVISVICLKNNKLIQYFNFLSSIFRSLKISVNNLKTF